MAKLARISLVTARTPDLPVQGRTLEAIPSTDASQEQVPRDQFSHDPSPSHNPRNRPGDSTEVKTDSTLATEVCNRRSAASANGSRIAGRQQNHGERSPSKETVATTAPEGLNSASRPNPQMIEREAVPAQFSQITRAEAARDQAPPTVAQQSFIDEMSAQGINASHPPSQGQLREYFSTFNNRRQRSRALPAYERYSDAYHVHIANTRSFSRDVRYSPETQFGAGRRVFEDRESAIRHARRTGSNSFVSLPTADASSFDDVTSSRRMNNGRYVNDCEGYAFMAQDLLGPEGAGFRIQQAATRLHSMTVIRDPRTGRNVVASNGDIFNGRNRREALDRAYGSTGHEPPSRYFFGDTQANAQAQWILANQETVPVD